MSDQAVRYRTGRLTEDIIRKHIRDLSIFRPSHFLAQNRQFISEEFMHRFLFLTAAGPESFVIFDARTRQIAALVMIYPPRREFLDANIAIFISRQTEPAVRELAAELKVLLDRQMKLKRILCVRASIVENEQESMAVLEEAGFQREAVLEEEVLIDGKYRDCPIYTLFKDTAC